MTDLELWAGIECSVVRVGERYVDQVELTGHASRPDDIDRLAELGVRAVRYPVLWERVQPHADREPDWSFSDERLGRLRALGIRPIVGLVHHGSGPSYTSLLDDSFVSGLAAFARLVAERYPWVLDFTPVNEPLTTARFSALYGHWYPHAKDDRSFVRALLNQCRAVRSAMRAIREVQPAARLVQTEDLGTTTSTRLLAYQAAFDNERRFASLDLLTGRLGVGHPLWDYLRGSGADEAPLISFTEDPCPPDVVGLNYYVTSDRFLDDRTTAYPPHVRGGNGRDAYADVEAVRVGAARLSGHRRLLELLWDRYRLPVAVTEAHLACAPEEQVRWLVEAWRGAQDARRAGADVRAVTAWAAFGATDWDSLLTQTRGRYEPGAFDVRGGVVRPAALARVCSELARHGESTHPVLEDPGWWRRDSRILYHPPPRAERSFAAHAERRARPILVTGARGTLGRAIARVAHERGLAVVALSRGELDVCHRRAVTDALDAHRPWAVVNAAGFVDVDRAERDRAACMRANGEAAAILAEACAARGIRFATYSSDLVFDGSKRSPYVERDPPAPINTYGASKVVAERLVLERNEDALVARTSAFFGPWDEANFVHVALEALQAGKAFRAATDAVVSPTFVPHLAAATLTLIIDGARGIWHLATPGEISWFELARRAAALARIPTARLVPCAVAELGLAARRPAYGALASERAALLAPLDAALPEFVSAWVARSSDRAPALGEANVG